MTETLAHGYSFESTQHDSVEKVFISLCVLVLWKRVRRLNIGRVKIIKCTFMLDAHTLCSYIFLMDGYLAGNGKVGRYII